MNMNEECIQTGLCELGIQGRDVAVHASLRSFGHVTGGAEAVVHALLKVCRNVLMPTFCEIGRTNPPQEDRPRQNGWDYAGYRKDTTNIVPFDPDTFDATSKLNVNEMGRIPAEFLRTPGTFRSKHPSVSWAANGPDAAWYTAGHIADDPNLPLKRLMEKQGAVLLLGVDLAGCTAIHLAEEVVGRSPFIRWVLYVDGSVRRVREYGCSDAFPKLAPHVASLAKQIAIGQCHAVCYPITQLVKNVVKVLATQPQITLCGRQTLCRCQDSMKGGPKEDGEANQTVVSTSLRAGPHRHRWATQREEDNESSTHICNRNHPHRYISNVSERANTLRTEGNPHAKQQQHACPSRRIRKYLCTRHGRYPHPSG